MKLISLLLTAGLSAFSINLSAQTAVPEPSQSPTPQAFETSGYVDAKSFVPASKMTGTLHTVAEQAYNNGLQNTYQLTSGGRTLDITGTPLLLQRINEIYALDYLRSLSKSQEFGEALAKAAGAKLDSAIGIVKDPGGTLRSLPQGASRFFGGIGEALKGGKSENEGAVLDQIAGTNKAKAELAIKLGVSPYTDNRELQDELTNTARVVAGGGLVVSGAAMAATGGLGATLTVIGVNQTLQNALVNSSPEDLRIMNRKKLLALGLSRTQTDAFLMHPNYTPWQETITTDALARIGVNPKAFIKEACLAATQEDASYFQRLAQLLLQYHSTTAPLKSIRIEGGLVCALDKAGTLVFPVSLDYAIWSERIAGRVGEFSVLLTSDKEIKALALWTDGQLSTRLCDELKNHAVSWKMLALDTVKN